MLLGYNTNGFADHPIDQTVEILAEIGYQSVAITIDHDVLNPSRADWPSQAKRIKRLLGRHQMRSVIETGARFLLDPRHKHQPTLMADDPAERSRRVLFLQRAIDVAAELGSGCMSFWSGALPDQNLARQQAFDRLVQGLTQVIAHAERRGVTLGFEPEPGMFIDSMASYRELLGHIDAPPFKLTIDVGHLHCLGEIPIADHLHAWATRLVNVHIEDMRHGVHEHLMFREGEIDFPPVIQALTDCGYRGGLHVELSRHSHMAPAAAATAFRSLTSYFSPQQDARPAAARL
jgi:L-ribulose-5-phosphate 3-epimerase